MRAERQRCRFSKGGAPRHGAEVSAREVRQRRVASFRDRYAVATQLPSPHHQHSYRSCTPSSPRIKSPFSEHCRACERVKASHSTLSYRISQLHANDARLFGKQNTDHAPSSPNRFQIMQLQPEKYKISNTIMSPSKRNEVHVVAAPRGLVSPTQSRMLLRVSAYDRNTEEATSHRRQKEACVYDFLRASWLIQSFTVLSRLSYAPTCSIRTWASRRLAAITQYCSSIMSPQVSYVRLRGEAERHHPPIAHPRHR